MYILNENNEPVAEPDTIKWARWFEETHVVNGDIVPRRRVAFTRLNGGIVVSTAFLGIDHAFGGGPPMLWETMIFRAAHDGEPNNWAPFGEGEYQERYTSHDEAIAGHTRAVDYVLARGIS